MRTLLICTSVVPLFAIFAACAKKQDDTQPPATAATAYPPQGYAPQAYPAQTYPAQGYPQAAPQSTYGQQPYPATAPTAPYGTYPAAPQGAPAPAPTPAQTAPPAASGQMAVPGPIAFQCQNDVPCGTHHCNLQYGKCAFPCQSAADCIAPNQCSLGLCVVPFTPPH
jgi:hypothetical protein